jgi:hypothetical protein
MDWEWALNYGVDSLLTLTSVFTQAFDATQVLSLFAGL